MSLLRAGDYMRRSHEKERWQFKVLTPFIQTKRLHERSVHEKDRGMTLLRAGDYTRKSHEKEWWQFKVWSSLCKLRHRSLHVRDGSLHEKDSGMALWRAGRSLYKLRDRNLHEKECTWKRFGHGTLESRRLHEKESWGGVVTIKNMTFHDTN